MPAPAPKNIREKAGKIAFSSVWGLVDLLLPPACRLCGEPTNPEQDFCHSCQLSLTLSEPKMASACPRCGRPGDINSVKSGPSEAHSASKLPCRVSELPCGEGGLLRNEPTLSCKLCEKEKFQFDRVVAHWTYEGRVCDAVIAAKYARQAPLGHALGLLLGDRVAAATIGDSPDIITVVPSTVRRQLTRGGRNGNVAIAEGVKAQFRNSGRVIPLIPLLRTTRAIKKQAWLSDKQRLENVRGAFAAKKSYAWLKASRIRVPRITDKHILLVDDVLTTGATSNEVSGVLRSAGARRVTLAVVARAVWS